MRTTLSLLVVLIVGFSAGTLASGRLTEAQGKMPTAIYFGQTFGNNLYLETQTGHLWLMDLGTAAPSSQPKWIDLGRFEGPGQPFGKQ